MGTAVTTAAAFSLGVLSGHVEWGAWAFLGGFTSFYVSGQPYRARAGILFFVMLGMAAAMAVGSLSGPWWAMAAAFGLLALAATYLAGAFHLPLPGAFMFILVACVAAATPAAGQGPERVGFALAGGAIAWVVGMSGWPLRYLAPEADRVTGAYAAVAAYVTSLATEQAASREHQAATALREAVPTRPRSAGDAAVARLAYLAGRAQVIFWAAVALSGERSGPLDASWRRYIERLGATAAPPSAEPPGGPPAAGSGALERRFTQAVADTARTMAGPRPTTARPPAALHAGGRATPPFLPHAALRTGIAVGAAVVLAHLLGLSHPYWLPLTTAAVLQGHTVEMLTQRAIQRVIGTVGGLVLAAVLIAGLHPPPLAALAVVLVLQAAMRITMVKNYGLAVMPMTAFALLIIYVSSGAGASGLVVARLGDTLLGVALALAATYLLWARASSRHLPGALAQAIRDEARLFRALCAPEGADVAAAVRRLETALNRLFRTAEDALSEVPASHRAERLWPAVASATRLGYLLMAAQQGALALDADEATAAQVGALLGDLAASAEGRRPSPQERPLPDLGGPGQELRTLAVNLLAWDG